VRDPQQSWFGREQLNAKKLTTILVASLVLGLLFLAPLSNAFAAPLHRPPPRVPEIDPSIAISGLAMLGGGVLLIANRFRRRRS